MPEAWACSIKTLMHSPTLGSSDLLSTCWRSPRIPLCWRARELRERLGELSPGLPSASFVESWSSLLLSQKGCSEDLFAGPKGRVIMPGVPRAARVGHCQDQLCRVPLGLQSGQQHVACTLASLLKRRIRRGDTDVPLVPRDGFFREPF